MTHPAPTRPDSPWLLRPTPRPAARLTLYCLPHAGGGASAYRAWPTGLPEWIEVVAVQLPGRENRIRERPAIDLAALAQAVSADHGGAPYALFGHSNGALLAFELAHLLGESGPGPVYLGVSGAPHPALLGARREVSRLGDRELVDWMVDQGGVPEQVSAQPELLELVLPALRADLGWLEAYRHRPRTALGCPLSAFAGETDERVPGDGLTAWSTETAAAFTARRYPGGHFYLTDGLPVLLRDMVEDLSGLRY
ncbi:thioesterase II family protein [Kitasatospora brasiliensis]|uniref:thioesterase II family protein n=1 Tax=Kitasatospora brasiliensis TaxID=3058040 RepID=UPI00292F5CC8|nr:thioesterase domain-containing protein [Kitasatospora sp. K002]